MNTNKNTKVHYTIGTEPILAKSFTVAADNIHSALELKDETIADISEKVQDVLLQDKEKEKEMDSASLLKLEKLFQVEKQYTEQVEHYRELGWIESKNEEEGMMDMFGIFRPIPTLKEVQKTLIEEAEKQELDYKSTQGFGTLLLVPMGKSVKELYQKLAEGYTISSKDKEWGLSLGDNKRLKEHKAWCIKNERINSYFFEKGISHADFTLNINENINELDFRYILPNSDITVYKNGGITKNALFQQAKFPGWQLHLVQNDTSIHEVDDEISIVGDRPQLTTNFSAQNYVNILKNNEMESEVIAADRGYQKAPTYTLPRKDAQGKCLYRHESGITLETYAAWALYVLRTKHQLMDGTMDSMADEIIPFGMTVKGEIPFLKIKNSNHFGRISIFPESSKWSGKEATGFTSIQVC